MRAAHIIPAAPAPMMTVSKVWMVGINAFRRPVENRIVPAWQEKPCRTSQIKVLPILTGRSFTKHYGANGKHQVFAPEFNRVIF